MLENGALLLRPCTTWSGVPAAGEVTTLEPARTVCDALTEAPLGFAGWRRRGGLLWPRWLSRRVLAVHEVDDAPLLFTVHQLWGLFGRWEVRDADSNVLGVLCGPLIKDRFGRNLALWERSAEGLARACDSDGRELLTAVATIEGTRVAFAAGAEGNPFLKMVLLAAALVEAPDENRS